MRSTEDGAALQLARFVSATRYEHLPSEEQARVKARVLDAIICALAGRRSDAARLAQAQGRHWARPDGVASIWFSALRATVEEAAFTNSIFVHSILLDDLPVHAGCVTVPVGLALAEAERRSGAAFLAAVALGYEVQLRMDLGHFSHRLMAKGFRHSSVNASYAAGATAASLMALSAEQTADMFGLTTALLNPGTMEPMGKSGSSERFVQMAGNARAGVLAASLAPTGFRGSRETFDGTGGLFSTYDRQSALPAGMIDGLGDRWHISNVFMKPYPSAGTGTVPIYCAEKAARAGIEAGQVQSVRLAMRSWGAMTGAVHPGPFVNGEQAMVSALFGIAATIRFEAYNFDTVTAGIGDLATAELAARIEVRAFDDPATDIGMTCLEFTMKDGSSRVFDAADMPASFASQPDWQVMIDRFDRMAPGVSPADRARVVDAVATLDRQADCAALLQCLRRVEV